MDTENSRAGYHHGDLRATLVATALEMLEANEPFSLRAVARRAGVSSAAPYRHFSDRGALEAALAAQGMRELLNDLKAAAPAPSSAAGLGALGLAYVRFALRRPALFRLMFGQACDDRDDERGRASDALHELLETAMREVRPGEDPAALATAGWSLAHGLAALHLDGKLPSTDPAEVEGRVRSAFAAVFAPPAPAPAPQAPSSAPPAPAPAPQSTESSTP